LTKLWSLKLFATAIKTPPELNFGQGVFHCALQTLLYDLIEMHKLTHKIEEVIAFTNWLSDKQIFAKHGLKSGLYCHLWTLETNVSTAPKFMQISAKRGLKSGLYCHLWTLETNVSTAPKFMQICTRVDHDIRNKFYFGSGD
jgi:hypothetical protein